MEFAFRNVNDAFSGLVRAVHEGEAPTRRSASRYGDVIQFDGPVTVQYEHPCERVLFNAARDCNPFFHLYESLWMLAGRRDVAPLAWYNSKMAEFSDNGITYHGAYGHRWRRYFCIDQLDEVVRELKADPHSRRVVLQMWSAEADLGIDVKTLDKPCNSQAYFAIREAITSIEPDGFSDQGTAVYTKFLDMTVCNRSNDLIWGMLGANVVHFSMLQEYLAARIGVGVGNYYQFTNNLHVYTERWTPEKWLADVYDDPYDQPNFVLVPLVTNPDRFDTECTTFVNHGYGDELDKLSMKTHLWTNKFFPSVAIPMAKAFAAHKQREYGVAEEYLTAVLADDWRIAGLDWIKRREANWPAKGSK
ncbi:MAG: thymidylate synthase [Dehalococcoidia bacterium]|jgi:thymidylate synthase